MMIARPLGVALTTMLALGVAAESATARPRPRRAKHFEANKGFGLGIMLGAPTGLSGKYYYASDKAFDFGVGAFRYYRQRDGLQIHVDHLWHPVSLVSNADFEMPLYLGVGFRLFDFNDDVNHDGTAIGLRAPIGVAFDLNRTPIDIFVELALVVDLFVGYDDRYGADLNGAVGFRFYFN
ncbi:MAG: hypothetical protein IPL61_01340 [Myxococcales bacterium]|nr:hypothetical protein [Myxococcales bacterium]